MLVATVLSCADPKEAADHSIMGEYQISPNIEFNNKEKPHLSWSNIQKNNPLTEELKSEILQVEGVNSIECYLGNYVNSDVFGDSREGMLGVPESGRELLEQGIIEGKVTYDELKNGDKIIIDQNLLHWYPTLQVGDEIEVETWDGEEKCKKHLTIAAIGDYDLAFTSYRYLIMAEEGLRKFSRYNLNMDYRIFAKEKYNPKVEAKLKEIVTQQGELSLETWKYHYDTWSSGMSLTRSACYAFLGVLGAICMMNMINMMIHSVHVRKKEIGMLQAVGMSDGQLQKMLQLEGLFYTLGTLIVAIAGGSILGYPVFQWARKNGMFGIRTYHYPVAATIIMIVVMLVVQILMICVIGKSLHKHSLIDRIRFEQ